MKDAVKRTINNVKLYFRRRKLLKAMMRQWGETLVMQEDQARAAQLIMQPAATPATTTVVRTDSGQPYISTEPDAALEKSVNELVFAIDQEAAAASQAPFARQDPVLAAINRRIGVN